ncbi:piggyBac transposable element-derived protein 3-like [Argiope bruennichi]|uniref:piggyBac transposable element-derived protein 3-like n=1 Tax=Argiope bruennichi TaxID=94029 RepID=UPI00249587DB|nr:piggyBac transposable element-derived protein 3-like [Argiope bruennichi]
MDFSVEIVPQTMSRNRFFQILANVHVNDNLRIPQNNQDKLYKLRPLMTSLNGNFQSFRLPIQYQSIDVSMVLFKGRSALKQYNPMKPIKRGYKLWCRADMSGFIYQFDVYQGKVQSAETNKLRNDFGLGRNVVKYFTQSFVGNNHAITMDNYYSSLELYEYLKSQHIYAFGTIRSERRGLPKFAGYKDLQRGDFDHEITHQGISYFKWKDNRCVHLLSNYHGNGTCTVQRTQKDGTKLDVRAPTIVKEYNEQIGMANILRAVIT